MSLHWFNTGRYEQQCSPVMEKKCTTGTEAQCEVVNERKCETVEDEVCEDVPSKQCRVVNDRKCSLVPKQECRVSPKPSYSVGISLPLALALHVTGLRLVM